MKHRRPLNSSVTIAKLLRSEGFTDYVANGVTNYWLRNCKIPHIAINYQEIKKHFTNTVTKGLTPEQKLVLGKFIGLHKKMAFETGLRVGMATKITIDNKEIEDIMKNNNDISYIKASRIADNDDMGV